MTSLGIDAPVGAANRSAPFESNAAARSEVNAGRSHRALRADAIAVICSAGVATLLAEAAGTVVWLTAGYVTLMLLIEATAVPSYERLRSLRPTTRMLALGGLALLLTMAFELLRPVEARGALLVVCTAAAVRVTAVGAERLRRRPHRVLLVGGRVGVGKFVGQWAVRHDVEIKGICLAEFVDESAPEMLGIPILGSLDDVASVASDLGVDEVVVSPGPLVSASAVRRLGWSLEDLPVELLVATCVHGTEPDRVRPRMVGRKLLLSVRPARPSAPVRVFKAGIDRVGAALLIVLLAPLFLLLLALIRWDSPGGAIFRQRRIGLDGVPFTMLKFRTMVIDAESLLTGLLPGNEANGPLFKLRNDPRTTRIGRLLRRSSLDELPQLFNVLAGQMSLIGPRPGLPAESSQYDDWVARRLRVKPGMTGSWQVSGRSTLSWPESVRLDLDYVDNVSIARDLSIAARTVQAVIGRDGAM